MNLEFLIQDAIPHAGVQEIGNMLIILEHKRVSNQMTLPSVLSVLDAVTRRLLAIDRESCDRWVYDSFKLDNFYLSPVPYFAGVAE